MKTGEDRKVRSQLTRPEARKVEDWILKNKSEIESGNFSKAKVADLMKDVVGREVSTANVYSAAKAVGVKFKKSGDRSGRGARNHALAVAVMILTKQVSTLAEALGVEVSVDMAALAKNPLGWMDQAYREYRHPKE